MGEQAGAEEEGKDKCGEFNAPGGGREKRAYRGGAGSVVSTDARCTPAARPFSCGLAAARLVGRRDRDDGGAQAAWRQGGNGPRLPSGPSCCHEQERTAPGPGEEGSRRRGRGRIGREGERDKLGKREEKREGGGLKPALEDGRQVR